MSNYLHIGQRLKEERERIKLNQDAMASVGGVGRKSQFNYESGDRCPDASYLSALSVIGVDVQYVITGQRNQPLTDEEKMLLESWRKADFMAKHEALKRLSGDDTGMASQKFHGNTIGQVVDGDIKNQEFVMFQQGQGKK